MERTRICGVDAEVATSAWARMRGLIGRRGLAAGCGLLIPRCNAVHTCFMRFPIDVTFLDGEGRVVKVVRNVRPWRLFVWGGFRARQALETPSKSASCAQATAS